MDLETKTEMDCRVCKGSMVFDRRVFDSIIWKCANPECGHEADGPEPGTYSDKIRQSGKPPTFFEY